MNFIFKSRMPESGIRLVTSILGLLIDLPRMTLARMPNLQVHPIQIPDNHDRCKSKSQGTGKPHHSCATGLKFEMNVGPWLGLPDDCPELVQRQGSWVAVVQALPDPRVARGWKKLIAASVKTAERVSISSKGAYGGERVRLQVPILKRVNLWEGNTRGHQVEDNRSPLEMRPLFVWR